MDHPFRKILLATEHTEFDAGSERVALDMAKRCGLPLSVVVPVVSSEAFEVEAQGLADRAEQRIASRMKEFREMAKQAGIVIDVNARRGEDPAEGIVDEAERIGADLIVIRRRGRRSFIARLLVGEMVSRVVALSSCSVLMVPRACSMWSRGILAALDGSDLSGKVLSLAAAIASQCDLPLHALSVAQSDGARRDAERIVSESVKIARGLGVKGEGLVLTGKPCDGILGAPVDADLIVVGMGNVGSGGTAQKVVGQSEKPVLAVHG